MKPSAMHPLGLICLVHIKMDKNSTLWLDRRLFLAGSSDFLESLLLLDSRKYKRVN